MAGLAERSRSATMVKRPGFEQEADGEDSIVDFLSESYIARGYLLKLSQKKKWQRRWWEIRGPYLMYWVSEKQANSKRADAPPGSVSMPDAAIDLRCISSAFLDGSELVMHSNSEREFRLKPSVLADQVHMKSWLTAIRFRISEISKFSKTSGYGDGEVVISEQDDEGVPAEAEEASTFRPGSAIQGITSGVADMGLSAAAEAVPSASGTAGSMAKAATGSGDASSVAGAAAGALGSGAASAAAGSSTETAPPDAKLAGGASIQSIWPAGYSVKIMLGAMENKKHPTYQCAVYKDGSTKAVSGEGCIKRFGAYRDLNQVLVDKFSLQISSPFPKTMTGSMWGLSPTEVQKRCTDLDAWMQAVIETPMSESAATTVAKFLEVQDPVLNAAS